MNHSHAFNFSFPSFLLSLLLMIWFLSSSGQNWKEINHFLKIWRKLTLLCIIELDGKHVIDDLNDRLIHKMATIEKIKKKRGWTTSFFWRLFGRLNGDQSTFLYNIEQQTHRLVCVSGILNDLFSFFLSRQFSYKSFVIIISVVPFSIRAK